MTARYQLVYYVPDTFLGERLVLGAHVWNAANEPSLVARPIEKALARLPATDDRAHHMEALVRGFEATDPSMHLPTALGPDVELGPVRDVPASALDAAAWVRSILSSRTTVAEWIVDTCMPRVAQVTIGVHGAATVAFAGELSTWVKAHRSPNPFQNDRIVLRGPNDGTSPQTVPPQGPTDPDYGVAA